MRTEDQRPLTELSTYHEDTRSVYHPFLQSIDSSFQFLKEAYGCEMVLLIYAAKSIGKVPQHIGSPF